MGFKRTADSVTQPPRKSGAYAGLTDEQAARLFVANGYIFMNRSQNAVTVRIAGLDESTALALKRRYQGSISIWRKTGQWYWQTSHRLARRFLCAVAPWVIIHPTLRPEEPSTGAEDGA